MIRGMGAIVAVLALACHGTALADAEAGVTATAAPSATVVAAPPPAAPAAPVPAPASRIPAAAEKPEPVGSSMCLSCHSNRDSFRGNMHAKAWPRMKGIDFESSCEACHGPGSLHAAAAGDRSNPGFATIHYPVRMGAKESSAMCLKCHQGGKRLHWDNSVHETRGVDCLDCHSIHAGHPQNLRAEKVMDVCLRCHQNLKAELRRQSHHPIVEGRISCADCHNPHGTAGERLLVGNAVNDTCFKCHADKRGPFLWEHKPVSEDCTVCHVSHGSVHDRLLRQKAPYLCQSCHSGSRHPGTPNAINTATPGDVTFEKLRVQVYYRACLNCHPNIHGSNHPAGNRFLR